MIYDLLIIKEKHIFHHIVIGVGNKDTKNKNYYEYRKRI